MSYKWGTNGNDLNWEMIEFLNMLNEDLELAIFRGEAELDEDGEVTEKFYQDMQDSNPTMIYYAGEQHNIQEILKKGEKLDNYVDWYIVHDTNDNFVTLVGNVPDEYLTESYIHERNEAEEN